MRIGIDIDGVLTNDDDYMLDCLTKFGVANHLPALTNPNAYEYDKCDWSSDWIEAYRREYFVSYIEEEPPRKFAAEVIKKWHEEGYEIFIITARYHTQEDSPLGAKMRDAVIRWLEKYNIYYDQLVFTTWDKRDAIKKHGIDMMIEDSPHNIPLLAPLVPILCFDTRYNRHLTEANMMRVFSWYDIYQRVEEYIKRT